MDTDSSKLVLVVLQNIPTHRESSRSVDEIVYSVAQALGRSNEFASGLTFSTIGFLNLFGILDWHDKNRLHLKGQIPHYFLQSLEWYFSNHQEMLCNWDRDGTARDIKINNLLESAPYFLKIMERRRIELSEKENLQLGFSRHQPVALIMIKAVYKKKSYFLNQWDERSEQYQMIGGRQRPNETNLETAKRELNEEIREHDLVYGRDYDLVLLNKPDQGPIKMADVSRTYGALTAYEFWLYSAKFKLNTLSLSVGDKWISIDEMMKGSTTSGKRVSDARLCRTFAAALPNGLEELPISINSSQLSSYSEFVEVKPKLWFITVDIKGIFLQWRERRKLKSQTSNGG